MQRAYSKTNMVYRNTTLGKIDELQAEIDEKNETANKVIEIYSDHDQQNDTSSNNLTKKLVRIPSEVQLNLTD